MSNTGSWLCAKCSKIDNYVIEAGYQIFYWDDIGVAGSVEARRYSLVLAVLPPSKWASSPSRLVLQNGYFMQPRKHVCVVSPYKCKMFKLEDYTLIPGKLGKVQSRSDQIQTAGLRAVQNIQQQAGGYSELVADPFQVKKV